MIILRGAFQITIKKVIETILSILLFRFTFHYFKLITGIGGFYAFFLVIFINSKIKKFTLNKLNLLKQKYFPQYVDNFKFDIKKVVLHDLRKVYSSPSRNESSEQLSLVTQLSKDEIKQLRFQFDRLKNEANENLFSFIFHSATKSSLISLFTILFVEYFHDNYDYSIFSSLAICVSFAFIISFVACFKYTNIVYNEWNKLIEDIQDSQDNKRDKNKRFIFMIYNDKNVNAPTVVEEAVKPIAEVDVKSVEAAKEEEQQQEKTVRKRKTNKKSKEKEIEVPKKEEKKSIEKDNGRDNNSKEFPICVWSNEVENEEHLKVNLLFLNKKFSQNINEIAEDYLKKYLPSVLMSAPSVNKPGGNAITNAFNAISDLSNLFQNIFLMANAASTKDEFFTNKALKYCSVYITDYYDIDTKFSKFLTSKKFKLNEKWNEFVMFIWVKFKLYEYRKDMVNSTNNNSSTANTTPAASLSNLFNLGNTNTGANTTATPATNLFNNFGNTVPSTTNTPNLFNFGTNAATGTNNAANLLNLGNTAANPNPNPNTQNLFNFGNNAASGATGAPNLQPLLNLQNLLASLNKPGTAAANQALPSSQSIVTGEDNDKNK